MAQFKITAGIEAAGWLPGIGDTLRAAGKAIVLMLSPEIGKPLTRIRVLKTVAHLETRQHTASRTSRGTWVSVDQASVKGFNARKWGKLAEFWAWRIDQSLESDRSGSEYNWAADLGKDKNRCGSKANANAATPTFWGQGRGRVCKGTPDQMKLMGWRPATGKGVRTHKAIGN